jgi:hypothetical protein
MNRRLVFIVQSEDRIDHTQPIVRAWPTGGVFVAGDPRIAALPLARSPNTPLLVAHPEKLLPPETQSWGFWDREAKWFVPCRDFIRAKDMTPLDDSV